MLRGWGSCLVDKCDRVGPIFFAGVDCLGDRRGFIHARDPIFVFFRLHPASFDGAQADVDDAVIVHRVACCTCVGCADEEARCKGLKSVGICCRFSLQSSVIVLPYFVMNQSNICRKTVFGCFMRIGSYVSQIALGRFERKTSERAAFMVTISALIFWPRALVAFSVSHSLSKLQAEKSGTASISFRNGKKVEGYASVVKKE